jgi:hypothetical protein
MFMELSFFQGFAADADVAVLPCSAAGLGAEKDRRVQPFAIGRRQPFLEFIADTGRDHDFFLGPT